VEFIVHSFKSNTVAGVRLLCFPHMQHYHHSDFRPVISRSTWPLRLWFNNYWTGVWGVDLDGEPNRLHRCWPCCAKDAFCL